MRRSAESYAFACMLLIAACAATALSAAFAEFVITRGILKALGAEPDTLSDVAQRVASGNLSPVADADRAPRHSVLASMNTMQANLVELIGNVRASAHSIATDSTQIAAATSTSLRARSSRPHRSKKLHRASRNSRPRSG